MTHSTPDSKLNLQIYQEACEWLIGLRTSGAEATTRERFDAWLRKSPEHIRAYLEVSATWEDLALHDPDRTVSAEAHVARAQAEDNLVPLRAPDIGKPSHPVKRLHALRALKRRPALLALAATIMVAVVGGSLFDIYANRGTYSTALGEVRSISIADGTVIDLNAESRIRVRLSKNEREVDLLAGEVLFKVQHDPSRPFIVRSGAATIRDIGTEFDVYRKTTSTTVTVIEGRVAVAASSQALAASLPQQLLIAGEQVTVLPKAILQPMHADVAATTAWTQRRLVFDSVPLREVVQSFNRYNTRPIVIDDPELETFRVIGVFSSTDPSSLIRFLSAQPGINVIENDKEVRITRRRQ